MDKTVADEFDEKRIVLSETDKALLNAAVVLVLALAAVAVCALIVGMI